MMFEAGGAGATQVLVRQVEQPLVVGVGWTWSYEPLIDAEGLVAGLRATGARQFVVQEAFEMIGAWLGS